jgi:hypothetical protein
LVRRGSVPWRITVWCVAAASLGESRFGAYYLVDGANILWFDWDAFYGFPVALPADTASIPNKQPVAMAVDETNYYVMFGNELKALRQAELHRSDQGY